MKKSMNSLRFYFSARPIEGHEQKVILNEGRPIGYVRAELCRNMDYPEALETAQPLAGEIVLNSVGLDDDALT